MSGTRRRSRCRPRGSTATAPIAPRLCLASASAYASPFSIPHFPLNSLSPPSRPPPPPTDPPTEDPHDVTREDVERLATFVCEPAGVQTQVHFFMSRFDPNGRGRITRQMFQTVLQAECDKIRLSRGRWPHLWDRGVGASTAQARCASCLDGAGATPTRYASSRISVPPRRRAHHRHHTSPQYTSTQP